MKPLKETKLGKFLSGKGFDHILEGIGALVPGVKILDDLKDKVLGDPDKLDEESKAEFLMLYNLQLQELDKHLADVASARVRESDFVKATGHIDWFQTTFGGVMVLLFGYTIWVSSQGSIPEDMREIFIEGRAAVRDIVLAIAGYYWGSSAGSRVKDMKGR